MIFDFFQGLFEIYMKEVPGNIPVRYSLSIDNAANFHGYATPRPRRRNNNAFSVVYIPVPEEYRDGMSHSCELKVTHGDIKLFQGEAGFCGPKEQQNAQSDLLSNLIGALNGALIPTTGSKATKTKGEYFTEAKSYEGQGRDYLFMSVIDWDFRTQRPQHLARELASLGHRIFYFSVKFCDPNEFDGMRIRREIEPGIYEIQLALSDIEPDFYGGLTNNAIAELQINFQNFTKAVQLKSPTAIVQFPVWFDIIKTVPSVTVVHDCLDHVGGFNNVSDTVIQMEERLIKGADLVITTSEPLREIISEERESVVIRNAGDIDFFANPPGNLEHKPAETVIGYFGAISEWFDVDMITHAARNLPDWAFVLVGDTIGANRERLDAEPNIHLSGEQPYENLPAYLHSWDVATIPFQLNELIRCTNPVKLYEYCASGIPVVATAMPEVTRLGDIAYIAEDKDDFVAKLKEAVNNRKDKAARKERRKFARANTWQTRASSLDDAVSKVQPLVSIVVLAYNKVELTRACLDSLTENNDYDNIEIIVVDNASTDETEDVVRRIADTEHHIRYIKNKENLGFAGGNNIGIKEANGEFIILLNNDTYVTSGFVQGLIRPMQRDPEIGMTGPLTNNIGNEQKIALTYADTNEMAEKVAKFCAERARQTFETKNLAFFCVAISRSVINEIGGLDENFGKGFFEDDDYCRRVAKAGFKMVIADEVFVHHELSASFNALGQSEKQELFERNKAIFEEKWGSWTPHSYREEAGFGQ